MLHGRIVYERLFEISDPTDTLDPVDGKAGYFDRWAGQGNPAYEDAALYIIGELEGFGLEVIAHRYEYTDIMNVQNPEAYNICAYKWGSLHPMSGWSSERIRCRPTGECGPSRPPCSRIQDLWNKSRCV